jgi:hypothetical protein
MRILPANVFSVALAVLILSTGCQQKNPMQEPSDSAVPSLDMSQAEKLISLPLACVQKQYPNKPGEVLESAEDLGEPFEMHPAFYGCFDWHSSVHGHWSLVWLLKHFPDVPGAVEAREVLRDHITEENIRAEVTYFNREQSTSYERTYGWAWLLKLAEELYTWDDPMADTLFRNLEPLASLIENRFLEFLPKLNYPIRVGEHTNTAFGLCFALDYAHTLKRTELVKLIESRARDFYLADAGCPLTWEPGGSDFLSPCLEEADLMRRVLGREEFLPWLSVFIPGILEDNFTMEAGKVSDRSDGKLVHLDGLNFSRAWVLYGLAGMYPELEHLVALADNHFEYSFPNLVGDTYEGGHWLGSFAIYALDQRP